MTGMGRTPRVNGLIRGEQVALHGAGGFKLSQVFHLLVVFTLALESCLELARADAEDENRGCNGDRQSETGVDEKGSEHDGLLGLWVDGLCEGGRALFTERDGPGLIRCGVLVGRYFIRLCSVVGDGLGQVGGHASSLTREGFNMDLKMEMSVVRTTIGPKPEW